MKNVRRHHSWADALCIVEGIGSAKSATTSGGTPRADAARDRLAEARAAARRDALYEQVMAESRRRRGQS
jgi:hypothetical protein